MPSSQATSQEMCRGRAVSRQPLRHAAARTRGGAALGSRRRRSRSRHPCGRCLEYLLLVDRGCLADSPAGGVRSSCEKGGALLGSPCGWRTTAGACGAVAIASSSQAARGLSPSPPARLAFSLSPQGGREPSWLANAMRQGPSADPSAAGGAAVRNGGIVPPAPRHRLPALPPLGIGLWGVVSRRWVGQTAGRTGEASAPIASLVSGLPRPRRSPGWSQSGRLRLPATTGRRHARRTGVRTSRLPPRCPPRLG